MADQSGPSIPDLLHRLAAVARGEVREHGARHAAALEAEQAARRLESLLSEMEDAARTLDELAGAGLADKGQVNRVRAAISAVTGKP